MKNILSVFLFFFAFTLAAWPGDTTKVNAHNAVDMTWYKAYNSKAFFPTQGKSFHRVNMNFTIGCASTGCSDWDYTVLIRLLKPSGVMDSNVSSIDTISTSPLVLDTTWNIFEVQERFELGRMITPYGGYMRQNSNGYNSNWTHELVWDVTDFQSMLSDSIEFEIFYQGWSSGFSATLDFELIEGIPARKVIDIANIYEHGGFSYRNSATVEAQNLPAVDMQLLPNTNHAMVRVIPSGHGFDNSLSCAEFCEKNYSLKIDGNTTHTQAMWRDDCGLNPIYPQGGTWLYDRANWCPGGKAFTHDHDISSFISAGSMHNFDIDIEAYNIAANQDAASYNWTSLLFQIEEYAHQNDAEVMEIISPSRKDDHKRFNPICGTARIIIRNKGAQNLSEVVIKYGYLKAAELTFNWTGNLAPMEEEIVELPMGDLADWIQWGESDRFFAEVSLPNAVEDEYKWNDRARSYFDPVPVYPADVRLSMRTNTQGQQTWWELFDGAGNVVESGDGYLGSVQVSKDWILADGCYHLRINDRGKNGLSWWANNEGSGFARLIFPGSGIPLLNFNPDFGTRIDHWFIVGSGLNVQTYSQEKLEMWLYPNPGNDRVQVQWSDESITARVEVLDLRGSVLLSNEMEEGMALNTESLPSGVYLIQVKTLKGYRSQKRWIKL